jgi:hypothetical protein
MFILGKNHLQTTDYYVTNIYDSQFLIASSVFSNVYLKDNLPNVELPHKCSVLYNCVVYISHIVVSSL